MAYYTAKELEAMDFKRIGEYVKICKQASIYKYEKIVNDLGSEALIKKTLHIEGWFHCNGCCYILGWKSLIVLLYIIDIIRIYLGKKFDESKKDNFILSARPPLPIVKMKADKLTHTDEIFI